MNIELILKEIIINVAFDNISPEDIDRDTDLKADLGIDSITLVSVMIDIEEEFGITFESNVFDTYSMEKYGVILEQVTRLLRQKEGRHE